MKRAKICSVCNIPVDENYCGRCGQKISGKPATTISLVTDFFSNFFSVEHSGFATIFKILRNPKPIVENYYAGNRNYYASPGKVLLYAITLVAIHVTIFDQTILGVTFNAENLSAQYLFWLALFPILLLISGLAFIKSERRFSKHLISIVYISSSLFVVAVLLNDLIIFAFGDQFKIWAFVGFISLVFFWNSRVLTKGGKWHIVVNTLIQMLIFAAIVWFLVGASKE